MSPAEVAAVRPLLAPEDPDLFAVEDPDGDPAAAARAREEHRSYQESELDRLAGELEASRARQRALERYLSLLG